MRRRAAEIAGECGDLCARARRRVERHEQRGQRGEHRDHDKEARRQRGRTGGRECLAEDRNLQGRIALLRPQMCAVQFREALANHEYARQLYRDRYGV